MVDDRQATGTSDTGGGVGGNGNENENMMQMFRGFMQSMMDMNRQATQGQRQPEGEQQQGQGLVQNHGLERFLKMKPRSYDGEPDSTKAERWIESIEKIFAALQCREEEKVRFAVFKLEDAAEHWWEVLKESWDREHVPHTWDNFLKEFRNQFVPTVVQDRKEMEFLNLEQGSMTIAQYSAKFTELARYCAHLVPNEEKRVYRFVKGLRTEFRRQLLPLEFPSYQAAVNKAYRIEQDIDEHRLKQGNTNGGKQVTRGQGSKQNVGNASNNRGGRFKQGNQPPMPASGRSGVGSSQGSKNTGMVCGYCFKGGHTEDRCWAKQGKCLLCGDGGHL